MSGLYIDPSTKDAELTLGVDLRQPENPTAAAVYRRVTTQRGSVIWDRQFGSTLHEIRKIDQFTPGLVEAAAIGAVRPMVDSGEVSGVQVSAKRSSDSPNRIDFVIDAVDRLRRPFRVPAWVQV